jgi:hypothetical protein
VKRGRVRLGDVGIVALGIALSSPLPPTLSAQQPPNTVTVTGVVRDSTTGAAVGGALVTVSGGPRAIAAADGRFRLVGVALGSRELVVQRFGYVSLQARVTVTPAPQPLELRMTPDPLQLEGVTVTGNAKAPLSGVVRDAVSGEPLPWAGVWLSRDAVREVDRGASDAQGVFSISEVTTGAYLLRVEKLGYFGQIIPIGHVAPTEPVDVRLQPDSVVLKGLAAFNGRLEARRRSVSGTLQTFDEERLMSSVQRGMREFLENDALIPMLPCEGRRARNDCRDLRGDLVAPRVYIDELSTMGGGLEQLGSYDPKELYSVDVFICTPRVDRLGGWEIHVYTHAYMESQARRGRGFFPHCMVP